MLINLLVNAADAIGPEGGEIYVATELRNGEQGQAIEIKVADNGCGIAQQNLDSIFEPFFTTKDQHGTGLGLAVVWGIVTGARRHDRGRQQPGAGSDLYDPAAGGRDARCGG